MPIATAMLTSAGAVACDHTQLVKAWLLPQRACVWVALQIVTTRSIVSCLLEQLPRRFAEGVHRVD
eukprot:4472318-Prymnesium_polylepis.1